MRYSLQCPCWDCREMGQRLIVGYEPDTLTEPCPTYLKKIAKGVDSPAQID